MLICLFIYYFVVVVVVVFFAVGIQEFVSFLDFHLYTLLAYHFLATSATVYFISRTTKLISGDIVDRKV